VGAVVGLVYYLRIRSASRQDPTAVPKL